MGVKINIESLRDKGIGKNPWNLASFWLSECPELLNHSVAVGKAFKWCVLACKIVRLHIMTFYQEETEAVLLDLPDTTYEKRAN